MTRPCARPGSGSWPPSATWAPANSTGPDSEGDPRYPPGDRHRASASAPRSRARTRSASASSANGCGSAHGGNTHRWVEDPAGCQPGTLAYCPDPATTGAPTPLGQPTSTSTAARHRGSLGTTNHRVRSRSRNAGPTGKSARRTPTVRASASCSARSSRSNVLPVGSRAAAPGRCSHNRSSSSGRNAARPSQRLPNNLGSVPLTTDAGPRR